MSSKQSSKKSKGMAAPKRRSQPTTRNNTVTAPTAKSSRTVTVIKPRQGPKVERRTQLITTILSSSAFTVNNGSTVVTKYRLNPSNVHIFPSLAVEAANYDEYRFTYLRAYYRPFAATTTAGRVEICFDPDSQDEFPTARQELDQYSRSCASPVWSGCSIEIPGGGWKFVNDSNVVDRKLVDYGQLICATYGSTGVGEVGDWLLEFSVEFRKPQPTASLVQTGVVNIGSYSSNGPAYVAATEITYTDTLFSINLNVAGVFLLTIFQLGSAAITPTVAGNGTIEGVAQNVLQVSSPRTASFYTIRSTGVPNSTATFSMSGMTASNRVEFHLTRCRPSNAFV